MGEIMLHGDCLISRAAELHQLLQYHLHQADEQVAIDMAATGRCDLSFFQLICAATRSFAKRNKKLVLQSSLPVAVIQQFRKAGFQPVCAACTQNDCPLKAALPQAGEDGQNPTISKHEKVSV